MSGKVFKGKLGKGETEGSPSYKAGSFGYDRKMVDGLVEEFYRLESVVPVTDFDSHVREVYCPQLKSYPDLDMEGFIDAVIRRFEQDAPLLHARFAGSVLNPLIALKHELGYESQILDMRGILAVQENIIEDISATEEQPFSLVLHLTEGAIGVGAYQVAHSLKHCAARIIGNADQVGYHGSNSDYTIEDKAVYLGDMASDCAFRFPHVKDAVCTNERTPVHTGRHRFRMKTEGSYFELSVENSFFIHKNKLLIPDGKGSWKEVTPG